ncbi:hypothetical protein [Enterococcus gilvus]|uniref:Uncharacterized protein n=1 Tax=Enterococcus gilvus ATCC BAA-350 TaxID=1158614 RepID=R2XA89_9ENTE|nr:hypothetical protein [Enterococcus gilvus]EOI51513.1 hypothetical protein UKC_04188 [Enterococcus gilvus ATCC BAA-350]EOW77176.1 hypothetical protein I592_04152 [Enterococcus gilvus ATCC BAA-350]
MRDIGPLYLNRLEGDIVFVDPKNEFLHRQSNVDVLGKPGKDIRAGRLIVDECHNIYDPEVDRFVEKLRNRGNK